MPLRLTDAQRELRDEVGEYTRSEIEPRAAVLDRNEEYPREILDDLADRGEDAIRAFPMAKVAATEAAIDNANDAMALHGGIGYTTEKKVERYLLAARLLTIAGGPNDGHRDALAQAILAEEDEID